MAFPLAVVLGCALLMLVLGLGASRRVRTSGGFFVADRRLGPGLLLATLLAANIGAGSTVGAAGLGYRDGLAGVWWVGSAAVGSLALAFWIGPRLRAVAARHDLRTVGDYLAFRYDGRVRAVIAIVLWAGSLAILAGQLIALAWILNVVAGTPKWLGCVVGGTLITTYFAAGGLHASVRVNVVQLTIKLLGFAVALPVALAVIGGFSALAQVPAPNPSYWNPWESGASGWMYLPLLAPAFVVSPGLLQKIYGARDDRAVRWGVGINALGLLLYAGVPVVLGMAARAQFPALESHELALPALFAEGLPPLVGALGVAAVFSAEVSAADAVLFMLTTSIVQDFYARVVVPGALDRTLLTASRVTAVAAGACGTALAIALGSVIDALSIFYGLVGVSLFVPMIAGLFVKRAGTPEALASIAAGVAVAVVVHLAAGPAGVGRLTPAALGLAASAAAWILVFLARARR